LHEIDFTETNLSAAVFDHSDLSGSIFDGTKLEKADFRTAYNYSIDPERNRLKKAKFSLSGAAGLLDKHDIQIDL
jgi:fluoroquinolone resistance protein